MANMKIKNQFLISIITFSLILAVIGVLVLANQQQTAHLNSQEEIARDIQTRAGNLVYISSDYFLYQEDTGLTLWQTEYSSLSTDLLKLGEINPEQIALLHSTKEDATRLNSRWTEVVVYLQNSPRNVSVRVLPAFQTAWIRMTLQNQALIFHSEQLSQVFRSQIDQLNLTSIILIFSLLGLFGAYFIINYLITYRNTLKSVSELQAGIAILGSGNLNISLLTKKKDEIGAISSSVNQMAANLRTVTASKADLENEIAERKKAEEALRQSEELARKRAEKLEILQVKLEERAVEVEEYATRMEELAQQRAIQLKDAERMVAIGQTAGMVGHDIRNPLQAITSDVYLAKTELASTPDSEEKKNAIESLEEIGKNITYINKIFQDLQDYARPLKPVAKETDLEAIVKETLEKSSFPSDIKTKVNLQEGSKVVADPDILKRILTNLVMNAIQAMPDGGELLVEAKTEGEYTVINVQDSGVGIPDEVKDKLFTPLFTTKSKGQGFGLAVVKRMTEALEGTVTFESELGKGTKFIIHLPTSKKH
jgi:signal transduction histidine kinase